MLFATFCNQVHSYLTQHPAAPFPNPIIQNTQMCYCVSWGCRESSPGETVESSFNKNYFHMHAFSGAEQRGRCSERRATQGTNRFLNCQLVILSSRVCRMRHMLRLLSTCADDPHSHKNENTLGRVDADRWAGGGLGAHIEANTRSHLHSLGLM